MPELLKRMNVYIDIKDDIEWIMQENFICKNNEHLTNLKNAQSLFKEIALLLEKCDWSKEAIDNCLNKFLIEKSLKFKDIGPILRVVLTGKTSSPDIITIIHVLGCEICVNRLNYEY